MVFAAAKGGNNEMVGNSVRLNSIITLRCQTIEADSKKTEYKTFKLVDNPEGEGIENGVGVNSSMGKALRGGIKNQKVLVPGYDSVTIVDIVNDIACRRVGKDSIIEIELYKDFECTDLIGTETLCCKDEIRYQFNNKEINSVIKLYNPRNRSQFAKITKIKSL